MKELETKIIQKLHQHSASEATLHVPEDIRQITLRRFEDFEQLALREKYPNIYLESTPAGKKINHGTQLQGLFPELDQLVESEPMEKIAMEIFRPKNISKAQEIFARNPGGKSIIPHQDYIYERKHKNHRTLSLNVKLNPIKKLTTLRVKLDEQGAQMSAKDLVRQLMIGEPSVHVDTLDIYDGVFTINPMCLRDGDARSIASRIQDLLGSR